MDGKFFFLEENLARGGTVLVHTTIFLSHRLCGNIRRHSTGFLGICGRGKFLAEGRKYNIFVNLGAFIVQYIRIFIHLAL
jgi:hypothetical protein